MLIKLDIIQSLSLSVVIFLVGEFFKNKVSMLEKFSIPSPVIGGILFSIIALLGHITGLYAFEFDETLQSVLLIAAFTTIGFSASLKLLKKGGIQVVTFLILSIILVFIQNLLGVGLAKLFNLHPYIGLAAGSTALVGGPGTSAAFGPIFEAAGLKGGTAAAMAAATFGLVMGSLVGGPVSKSLIDKYNLVEKYVENEEEKILSSKTRKLDSNSLLHSTVLIVIAMGLGTIISNWLKSLDFTFPSYIGGMLAASLIRNILDLTDRKIILEEIEVIGHISLVFFLSMSLMSLKLWQLYELALPMLIILTIQVLVMVIFAYFIIFKIMGKDYDAAVMSAGACGFGLGATANAIANMEALTEKYNVKAMRAFFIVPLVGSLFIDFFNAFAITLFMNWFK
ncbi:Glutamate permease [Clostridium sp. N3C]|uniref:sodium/glutamate symporter n=1 Tax=Clostridium sp. N3C TaxID=1776758 RepID=UPI00092E0DE3|nr:sodium/glutamate symporter [Clostridium sp. N3C]SCN24503.1 Glutamate permease [Clostridium sp. N3C]